ncbi:MAG: aspartate kinase [Deltaproteobacteria bacterium]|nr:aspartate kinase [Deltaproteobacteria bacterium]MBW2070841.1 aspartate kinase [Deltaproteobacteria bacterium]
MSLIVQKYGGTSVANIERIKAVAERVIKTRQAGHDVVVILSAMAGQTDKLIQMAHELTDEPDPRELDVLLATGEQVTIALFSIAVKCMGYEAQSLLGHQARIFTDHSYGRARISEIRTEPIWHNLYKDRIPVIAGFQGLDEKGNITTLGRGGSDTTAVAVAAALSADVCEIYTDVAGVYTTDPNLCERARKLQRISYEEMLEMASTGAKILHIRSVEFAMKYNVPIHVRSSFVDEQGTMVVKEDKSMEKVLVSGVTYSDSDARITLAGLPDVPGVAARIFSEIAREGIVVDMIIQGGTGETDNASLSFTVPRPDRNAAIKILQAMKADWPHLEISSDENIAKVSVIGVGMRHHAGVAAKMFQALAAEHINIHMISTSEIKVSCVIDDRYTAKAVRVLHDAFALDKPLQHEIPK